MWLYQLLSGGKKMENRWKSKVKLINRLLCCDQTSCSCDCCTEVVINNQCKYNDRWCAVRLSTCVSWWFHPQLVTSTSLCVESWSDWCYYNCTFICFTSHVFLFMQWTVNTQVWFSSWKRKDGLVSRWVSVLLWGRLMSPTTSVVSFRRLLATANCC